MIIIIIIITIIILIIMIIMMIRGIERKRERGGIPLYISVSLLL